VDQHPPEVQVVQDFSQAVRLSSCKVTPPNGAFQTNEATSTKHAASRARKPGRGSTPALNGRFKLKRPLLSGLADRGSPISPSVPALRRPSRSACGHARAPKVGQGLALLSRIDPRARASAGRRCYATGAGGSDPRPPEDPFSEISPGLLGRPTPRAERVRPVGALKAGQGAHHRGLTRARSAAWLVYAAQAGNWRNRHDEDGSCGHLRDCRARLFIDATGPRAGNPARLISAVVYKYPHPRRHSCRNLPNERWASAVLLPCRV
jgi:hypothetical protein